MSRWKKIGGACPYEAKGKAATASISLYHVRLHNTGVVVAVQRCTANERHSCAASSGVGERAHEQPSKNVTMRDFNWPLEARTVASQIIFRILCCIAAHAHSSGFAVLSAEAVVAYHKTSPTLT